MTFWGEETSSLVVTSQKILNDGDNFPFQTQAGDAQKSPNSADSGQIINVIGEFIEFDQVKNRMSYGENRTLS